MVIGILIAGIVVYIIVQGIFQNKNNTKIRRTGQYRNDDAANMSFMAATNPDLLDGSNNNDHSKTNHHHDGSSNHHHHSGHDIGNHHHSSHDSGGHSWGGDSGGSDFGGGGGDSGGGGGDSGGGGD